MANAPAPANGQQLNLNPQQLGTLLVLDGLLAQMSTAANQLGGFLRYEPAAQLVLHAQSVLARDYEAMKATWQAKVQLAPASALSVIEGQKVG